MQFEKQYAVFLDKDGTLIKDIPYNVDSSLIELEPGVAEGLPLLSKLGYKLIIVSNQSGVALNRFEENDLKNVYQRLKELFEDCGAKLDGFYYCPHDKEGLPPYNIHCGCKKPEPGLIRAAAKDYNIDLSGSWMIGDILNDVESGNRAGCRSILIDNGNETEWARSQIREPNHIARNFLDATQFILLNSENTTNVKELERL